jgi:hypothetical protein
MTPVVFNSAAAVMVPEPNPGWQHMAASNNYAEGHQQTWKNAVKPQ